MIIGKAVIPGKQAPPAPSIPDNVNDATWEQISEVSIAGTGDTYWDVGDCKAVTLNGTIGTLSLINVTLYVFILDFNHPINKSTADNNIIWGGFKTALTGGVDVALCDSYYDDSTWNGTKYFSMNHWSSSNEGWKGCDLRYDILGGTSTAPANYGSYNSPTSSYDATSETISNPVSDTLMAALPSDLRAVLRLWNRYIDSKSAYESRTDADFSTATVDAISLLAEFEIFGTRLYANQYEQNHQKQMTYYSAGNSKIKYKHNATNTACIWRTASGVPGEEENYCIVSSSGTDTATKAHYSFGLAPAFRT